MKYANAVAFRQALETRLVARSKATGMPLDRLRKTIVFERFLARLLAVAPAGWVLKGGFALDLRLGQRARATRDIDLGRQDGPEQASTDLIAAQTVDLDEFFVFSVRRTDLLDAAMEGAAVRYRLTAELAGRRFEQVIVDVGFADALPETPDLLDVSDRPYMYHR